MKTYRIFNQWRAIEPKSWSFVPFSIWRNADFFGFIFFNICFEWPLSKLGEDIHNAMDPTAS